MESRIARLESDVAHLRSDVADIKVDLRGLRDKVDGVGAQLNAKIDAVAKELGVSTATLQGSIASAKVWALALYIALAATTLGTMARGFGWI